MVAVERKARRCTRHYGAEFRSTNDQRLAALAKDGCKRQRRTMQRIHRDLEAMDIGIAVGHIKRSGAARRPGELDCLGVAARPPQLSYRQFRAAYLNFCRAQGRFLEGSRAPRAAFERALHCRWLAYKGICRRIRGIVGARQSRLRSCCDTPRSAGLRGSPSGSNPSTPTALIPPASPARNGPAPPGLDAPPCGGERLSGEEEEAALERFRELKRQMGFGRRATSGPASLRSRRGG